MSDDKWHMRRDIDLVMTDLFYFKHGEYTRESTERFEAKYVYDKDVTVETDIEKRTLTFVKNGERIEFALHQVDRK